MVKKIGALLIIFSALLLSLALISANLDIKKTVVSPVAIKDLSIPAVYTIKITNNGGADTFNIYSLVGLRLEPNESFSINTGETKEITLKAYIDMPLKVSPDYYSFEYKISGVNSGLQSDELAATLVYLKDAFNIHIDSINPLSDKTIINVDNRGGYFFKNVSLDVSSDFFLKSINFDLLPFEKKQIEVSINKEKARTLIAGPYIVNIKLNVENLDATTSTILKFEEMPGIETKQSDEGILLHRIEIEKVNNGNTNIAVAVPITVNKIASLFTTFNVHPTKKESKGFQNTYIIEQEIAPGTSLKVIAKTNWWILIGIIVGIILIYYLTDKYIRNKLVLRKTVTFVRTKGGEFALKVNIHLKARDFVEKIRIIDRLPPMVRVFERYGAIAPDRVDEANRRVEWNLSALGRGEERVLSYIVYSKVGVMGRFELPMTGAIYEYEGKIKEASSNPAFFNNEPGAKREE
jgi:hypothetical protein